jgi:isopentenyl-diphosphate delta-isomerase
MPRPTATSLIDRVDDTDEPIGLIERQDVFRLRGGFRVAHTFVANRTGQLLLQQVGAGRERSPLQWGSSVAAYLHAGETYAQAARRRLREELALDTPLEKLGAIRMHDQGATKFITLFKTHAEGAMVNEPGHIEQVAFWEPNDIERELARQPGLFTETFPVVYKIYRAAMTS